MPSNIPAPRVPMIDPRSGLVNRQWYTFFLNLFDLADGGTNSWTMNDLQQMPPVIPYVPAEPVDAFPVGGIVFWLGTVASIPAGWEEVVELRGRFPRGMASGGTAGVTGGNSTHNHEVTGGSMGTASTFVNVASGSSYSVATQTHTHSYSDITSSTSSLPPYVDGVWIRKL